MVGLIQKILRFLLYAATGAGIGGLFGFFLPVWIFTFIGVALSLCLSAELFGFGCVIFSGIFCAFVGLIFIEPFWILFGLAFLFGIPGFFIGIPLGIFSLGEILPQLYQRNEQWEANSCWSQTVILFQKILFKIYGEEEHKFV